MRRMPAVSGSTPPVNALTDTGPQPVRGLRIVIADDDRDAVLMLATLLRQEGHEVREVFRGDAVYYLVREFEPDAVLLDIGMPGLSGLDIARKLRESLGRACPLLVAITGWNKGADRILGQIAGFNHYLTKPYSTEQLLELLAPLRVSGRPL
jgi:two-component system, OmpR family, response regulator